MAALLELQFASPDKVEKFSCKNCIPAIQALRRCKEDRWDFDDQDGNIWPMQVQQGGGLYGFCPGKATWDSKAVLMFKAFIVCAETGAHWQDGGIASQPFWWVDLVSELLPRYHELRFNSRARAILGDGKGTPNGNQQGQSRVPNPSQHGRR